MPRTSPATRTGTASFSITGEALTDIAREFVVAERPTDAWRFLSETLLGGESGEADQVARLVLEGKSRLTGDSTEGIGVEDEDPESVRSYLKQIRYLYAGRVRIKGAWYRPSAEVVQYGPEDGRSATLKSFDPDDSPFQALSKVWRARVAHYCEEGQIVVTVKRPSKQGTREQFVIFEPVGEPPMWMRGSANPSEALKDFLAAGRKLDAIRAGGDAEYVSDRLSDVGESAQDIEEERKAQERAREEAEEAKEREYLARCYEIGARVRAQAGDDVFLLRTKSGREIRVPRAPFWNWALSRTSIRHLAPLWAEISPSGMKLSMDNPYHTDWMLGAGLDLNEDYNDQEIRDASYEELHRIQTELGEFEAAVLLPGRGLPVTGVVGKHITVLPNLDSEQGEKIRNALIIVSETGGPLAHCALVAIEREIPIFLVPDAVQRFPEGTQLTLDPRDGSVHVQVKRFL